jgi:hypothetical protein
VTEGLYGRLLRLGAPSKAMFWTTVAVYLLAIVAALLILIPRHAWFSAEVLTEQLEVVVPKRGFLPPWDGVELNSFAGPDGEECRQPRLWFDADEELRVNESDGDIRFGLYAQTEDQFLVRVIGPRDKPLAANVTCESGARHAAPGEAAFQVSKEAFAGTTFRLQGAVTLGGESASGSGARFRMVRAGTLRMTARSVPLGTGRVTESETLMAADTVRFFDSSAGGGLPSATLLIRYDGEARAFSVVSHVVARQAEVFRPGAGRSEVLSVAPGLWARIQAQREWVIILVIAGLLLKLLDACRAQYAYEKERSRSGGPSG